MTDADAPKALPSQERVRRKKFRRTMKTVETSGCQLPMEDLLLGTSFEVMSKVSMNPFVPLNS
jgi:hypothetical protein